MNKVLTLLITFACYFHSSISMSEPLIKLIVSPCEFNNKEVYTSGLLGFPNPLEPNKARLFLTSDDIEFNNFDQSIIVNFPDEISYKREVFANKFVNIQGIYDCSVSSHGHFGSGGFKSVSEIILASKNPDFNSKNFSNGRINEIKSKKLSKFGHSIISMFTENKTKENLFKLIFKNNVEEKNIKIERLNWIFNNYLADFNSENYKLCKIYEYEDQEYQESHGIIDGLICYSKRSCKLSEIEDAENLPDWSDSSNELCFSFESENNVTRLSLSQFY